MQDEHAVCDGIVEHDLKRAFESVRAGVADEVDRIAARPGGRQHAAEPLFRRRAQCRKLATGIEQRVGREHGEPAAVRDDRQPTPGRRAPQRESFRSVEQLLERPDTNNSSAAKCRRILGIGPREPARVRRGRSGTTRVAPTLDDEHRLTARGHARRSHETLGTSNGFDVQHDRRRLSVGGEIVQQIAEIHVGHVAERHDV